LIPVVSLAVVCVTILGVAVGRYPFLRMNRATIALTGATLLMLLGAIRLALPAYAEVERVMAALREARVAVQEMEIMQPDLEEVFVQIMHRS